MNECQGVTVNTSSDTSMIIAHTCTFLTLKVLVMTIDALCHI